MPADSFPDSSGCAVHSLETDGSAQGLAAAQALLERVRRWRWQVPLLAFLLVGLHQVMEHTWLQNLNRWQHFATQLLFYGLIGPLLAWWTLSFIERRVRETLYAYRSLAQTGEALDRANRWLEVLLAINRQLVQAEDEETLLQAIVELPRKVVPVIGASLLPFDSQGRPTHVVSYGAVEDHWVERWTNRLMAEPELRARCLHCAHQAASQAAPPCPLVETAAEEAAFQVLCLSLHRDKRDLGLLTLYLAPSTDITPDVRVLLQAMAEEMAMALETHRLRAQEIRALHQIQGYRRQDSLYTTLAALLQDSLEPLEADGGCVFLAEPMEGSTFRCAEAGTPPEEMGYWLQGLVESMHTARSPLLLGDVGNPHEDARYALLLAPLRVEERHLGCLVWWSGHGQNFARRHMRLATTLALQAALLVEHFRLSWHLEHQAALAERTRLAREIHDGLAQTLGYLKLRTGQIARWLQERELARAREALEQVRDLIGAAYVDVREAIDGLRLQPGEGTVNDWLVPLLADFRMICPVEIVAEDPPPLRLSPEIHVQLMRIVQEALGNVRKHAGATRVWIRWELDGLWMTVRIVDNGAGFDPDDVPPLSRHGLRIMQERAELLDGDFQIVSRPGQGTQVVVRLPIHREDAIHV